MAVPALSYRVVGLPKSKLQHTHNADRPACALVAALAAGQYSDEAMAYLRSKGVPEVSAYRWAGDLRTTNTPPTAQPMCIAGRHLDMYQLTAISQLTWSGGVLALGCGLGKTITALGAAEHFNYRLRARRIWIVAPLNAMSSWKPYVPYLTESGWTDVKIISMDSLHKIAAEPIGGVIIYDECFPAGTLVDTAVGPMRIEQIVEHRLPLTVWTERGMARVTGYLKKPLSEQMVDVVHQLGTITCTANHPIFTEEDGYVRADSLRPDYHTLRALRRASDTDSKDQGATKVLFHKMRRGAPEGAATPRRSGVLRPYAHAEPDVDAGGETASNASSRARSTLRTWWERARVPYRAAISRHVPAVCMGARHWYTRLSSAVRAAVVQGGLCGASAKISNRTGRAIAQWSSMSMPRREERPDTCHSRVVSITYKERDSTHESGSSTVDGQYVYCLETEHGSFYANGILVHNCHLLGGPGARRTNAAHTTRLAFDVGICLTGTFLHGGVEKTLSMLDLAIPGAAGFSSRWAAGEHFGCLVRKRIGARTVTSLEKPGGAKRAEFFDYIKRYVVMLSASSDSVRASLTIPNQYIHTIELATPWQELPDEAAHIALTMHAETGVLPNAQAVAHALCQAGAEDKIAWLVDALSAGSEQCVVFAHYTETLDALVAALDQANITWTRVDGTSSPASRIASRAAFTTGEARVFIGQIVAAGIGVDGLQDATTFSVTLDHCWRPDVYAQSLARTARRGQTLETNHFDLVSNQLQARVVERVRSGAEFNAEAEEWLQIRAALPSPISSVTSVS